QCEVGVRPALFRDEQIHQSALARARIADVDALALQRIEVGDAGFCASDDRQRLSMKREDRAKLLVLAAIGEASFSVIGVVLDVRLDNAELQVAALDGIGVEHGTAGGFHRAANAVLAARLVHKAADGSTNGIVYACYTACAHGDEALLLSHSGSCHQRSEHCRSQSCSD